MKPVTVAAVLTFMVVAALTTTTAAQRGPARRSLGEGGCAPSGGLNFICGVPNPEDLVLVPNTKWLVASGMAPGSGLHLVDTQAKKVSNLYAVGAAQTRPDTSRYAKCPGPLDPKVAVLHGLSLRSAQAGRYTVYATNHGGRQSIEVFELDARGATPSAVWVGCVLMPNNLEANSVAAFSDGSLLATVLIMPGKTFEDAFAQKITGAVFMWTPATATFRQLPGTELSADNGVETSPDDREFYVVSTTTKRILAFARNDTSKPLRVAQLTEFAPDNVRWTSDNRLITAGMIDNEPACGGAPRTPEGIRCSRGYIAVTIDPKTMKATEIARGPATPAYTGTAIAMQVGDELWLGSFNADRLAYRSLKK